MLPHVQQEVSGKRFLLSGPLARIYWTKLVVAVGCICGFLLSHRLWISSRTFPLVPLVSSMPRLAYPFDYAWFGLLLLLLVAIAVSWKPRGYILAFVVLLAISCAMDQCRWQPWVYQYLFMLAALGLFSWQETDSPGQFNALNICRLIVASIYFFSGLQKINQHFAPEVLSRLVEVLVRYIPLIGQYGRVVPFIEMGIGISLLTPKFRKAGVFAAVAMHWFILCAIGPFGLNWNSVVWPWNLTMIALDFLLFWNADFSLPQVLWRNPFKFQKAVLLLFGVMPFLSFFGWWDSYLSSSLYSANTNFANIYVGNAVSQQLPPGIQRYVEHLSGNNNVLKLLDWSFGELNVPPYPEPRVYEAIGADICKMTGNSPDVALYVEERVTLRGGGDTTRYTCLGTLRARNW